MPGKNYLDVAENAGLEFYQKYHDQGAIVMLNLLNFRATADYSSHPELAPSAPITGEEAYRLYMKHTIPFLKEAGSELLYSGKGSSFLIGPAGQGWDMVLLVKHRSADAFIAFARNEGYLQGVGHRTAALTDSRLLPLSTVS